MQIDELWETEGKTPGCPSARLRATQILKSTEFRARPADVALQAAEGVRVKQIGLGSLVGLVAGLLCWRGNQSGQLVSTFPDAFTIVMFAVLLAVTIRFSVHGSRSLGRTSYRRAGLTVATTAGIVFGTAVVGIALQRFTQPSPLLLISGFFTALGSALASGMVAVILAERAARQHGK